VRKAQRAATTAVGLVQTDGDGSKLVKTMEEHCRIVEFVNMWI
jgi:hypothetical protein